MFTIEFFVFSKLVHTEKSDTIQGALALSALSIRGARHIVIVEGVVPVVTINR
jgi:hypothetical protein